MTMKPPKSYRISKPEDLPDARLATEALGCLRGSPTYHIASSERLPWHPLCTLEYSSRGALFSALELLHVYRLCRACVEAFMGQPNQADRPRFIVGEVSKTWTRGETLDSTRARIGQLFEHIVETNRARGYVLCDWRFVQTWADRYLVETIIAVFEDGAASGAARGPE